MKPQAVLETAELQVLLVSFGEALQRLDRLKGFLNAEELQRGARFLDHGRRDLFFVGRGILRELLAERMAVEPQSITIREGTHGKPELAEAGGAGTIRFNLSHAGEYLLYAIGAGEDLGVDLESVRHDIPFSGMAKRYFSEREQQELFSLSPQEQIQAFYRCWTRKEAYLKGTGTGFSQPSTAFDVTLLPGATPALLAHRTLPAEPQRWHLQDLDVPEAYCAALAVREPGAHSMLGNADIPRK